MNYKIWGVVLYGVLSPLLAQNLGNYGEVFPVIEEDIRQTIMRKLHEMERTGELQQHQKEVIARVSTHVRRPKPVNLATTSTPSTFEIDPSIVVNQDIVTPDGALVASAGMHLNPFEQVSFSKTLFFFNADDLKQMNWVKKHYQDYHHVVFILTGGDVKDTSSVFGAVYFDLEGRLSSYFHLKHVPSIVNQKGMVWKVQEIGQNAF